MKMAIDGNASLGRYRVECECGTNWSGETPAELGTGFSPALPVAECIVHMRLEHPDFRPDIRFSKRFEEWLARYWDRESHRQATGLRVGV